MLLVGTPAIPAVCSRFVPHSGARPPSRNNNGTAQNKPPDEGSGGHQRPPRKLVRLRLPSVSEARGRLHSVDGTKLGPPTQNERPRSFPVGWGAGASADGPQRGQVRFRACTGGDSEVGHACARPLWPSGALLLGFGEATDALFGSVFLNHSKIYGWPQIVPRHCDPAPCCEYTVRPLTNSPPR